MTQPELEALREQSETVPQHSEQKELFSVEESSKTISSQKDTLLAEDTLLKNELARWQARVDHLLEVHDKMDPEEFRALHTLKGEHLANLAKIANLSKSVKQMGEERNEQKYKIKLLEEKLTFQQSWNEMLQGRHQIVLQEYNDNVSEQEEELKTQTENCNKFAQAARNWKTRFEEKNTKLQESEKNLNELKTSNLQEKSRTEEECQERQQELANKNQGLEVEKKSLLEELNQTKAALEEKSVTFQQMQDELKKINLKFRQQKKSFKEEVSTLKTANADKEGQLQAVKNLHQSYVSQLDAIIKLESSCEVSNTQPSPSPTIKAPGKHIELRSLANQAPPSIPQLNPAVPLPPAPSRPPNQSGLV